MSSALFDSERIWRLKRINFFKALSVEEMECVAARTVMTTYRRKELVYLPGQCQLPTNAVEILTKQLNGGNAGEEKNIQSDRGGLFGAWDDRGGVWDTTCRW